MIGAQPGVGPTTPDGQVVGSTRVLPGLGEIVVPLNIWLKFGTRKPVPYEPRNMIGSHGRKRKETFGLVVLPKPV